MGQAIEYDPQEWDFQEDTELESMQSEIILPNDFYKGRLNTPSQDDDFSQVSKAEISAYIDGEKIQLNHETMENLPRTQEEEAFRRQIEDLFELLELEKESGKEDGVRVYQTDSSPSRPWRFH